MRRDAVDPSGLHDAVRLGFSHAVEGEGRLPGQLALDRNGAPVDVGDLGAQVEQVLVERGGTAANVVGLRASVADHAPDVMEVIGPALARFHGDATPAAHTLPGVSAPAPPGLVIEIKATAVPDG